MILKISRALHEAVIAHCRAEFPKEACGFLAAEGSALDWGPERALCAVYPMVNTENSAIAYAMDPKEQLDVMKRMRERGQHAAAIYHSHTASGAYPSPVDVSLALSPDISYVLVSLKDPERPDLKSYRIDGRVVTLEAVALTP